MIEHVLHDPNAAAAAEKQMRAWALSGDLKDRSIGRKGETQSSTRTVNFISISREAGAGGSEIGQEIGRRLGWRVFDKNLLDLIADRYHVCRRMLDLVDETRSNWVYDVLGNWMDCQIVPHMKYFHQLCSVMLTAAHCEHAVFIGRGAQFLLPRNQLLAVRLVASPKYRTEQLMERTGMNEKDARQIMEETDAGRREFIRQFLRRDVADPHFYDLVINVERCGRKAAVDEIQAALERRRSGRDEGEPPFLTRRWGFRPGGF
jgi:hypothetical protein